MNNPGLNDKLYYYLQAFDDPELPDSAWWAKLEKGVTFYNQNNGTDFNEFETIEKYIYGNRGILTMNKKPSFSETERKAQDVNTAWYKLSSLMSDIKDEKIKEALADLFGEIVLLSDMLFEYDEDKIE